MINFLLYMVFSTVEFLSLMLLISSLFTFDWQYYKKEILLTSVSVTLLSYLFIVCNIEQWLLPVEIITLISIFKIGFKEKWLYSIWITVAGLFSYLVIQICILLVSIQSSLLTYAETSQPFGLKTYLLQSFTAIIVIAIAAYIKLNRQGFGFTFRTKFKRPLYLTIALMSVVICSICFYLYIRNNNYFYLLVSSFLCLFLVTIYFSYKKDHEEFTFVNSN